VYADYIYIYIVTFNLLPNSCIIFLVLTVYDDCVFIAIYIYL
jgi:hypothetical protein